MTTITERIERELGLPGLASILAEQLEPSDLQSLLLDVYHRRAGTRRAADVLADYASNRFVRPSKISARQMADWDQLALSLLPPECEPVELSPLCPLGACSVIADLDQNWSIPTIRNTEVVSDSTNVLALEAARRRRALKRADSRSGAAVHLAASHRLVRPQKYENPLLSAHFRVFSLCSAGRDHGSFQFELDAAALHIGFYLSALRAHLGPSVPLRVSLTMLGAGATLAAGVEKLRNQIGTTFGDVEVALDPERTAGREYYRNLCFWIHSVDDTRKLVHLVDGGAVDWTQRLLSDGKERLVVSGIGSDRVCVLRAESQGARADTDVQR